MKTFQESFNMNEDNADEKSLEISSRYSRPSDTSPRFETIVMQATYVGVWALMGTVIETGKSQLVYEIDVNKMYSLHDKETTSGFLEDGLCRGDRVRTEFRETLAEALQWVADYAKENVPDERP
tara:strand:- start:2042 stop:2413 length:372 start_codon:yes stop_codon:yes gene_type:complete